MSSILSIQLYTIHLLCMVIYKDNKYNIPLDIQCVLIEVYPY